MFGERRRKGLIGKLIYAVVIDSILGREISRQVGVSDFFCLTCIQKNPIGFLLTFITTDEHI